MKTQVKVMVDFESQMISTIGAKTDGTINFYEAGISVLSDEDDIKEHFRDKGEVEGIDYEVVLESPNLYYNVQCCVNIDDLIKLGWDFFPEEPNEDPDKYHIEITVDDEGKTTYCIVNTDKLVNNRIWEGSDRMPTGDDEQTIKDLYTLYDQGKIWKIERIY